MDDYCIDSLTRNQNSAGTKSAILLEPKYIVWLCGEL